MCTGASVISTMSASVTGSGAPGALIGPGPICRRAAGGRAGGRRATRPRRASVHGRAARRSTTPASSPTAGRAKRDRCRAGCAIPDAPAWPSGVGPGPDLANVTHALEHPRQVPGGDIGTAVRRTDQRGGFAPVLHADQAPGQPRERQRPGLVDHLGQCQGCHFGRSIPWRSCEPPSGVARRAPLGVGRARLARRIPGGRVSSRANRSRSSGVRSGPCSRK